MADNAKKLLDDAVDSGTLGVNSLDALMNLGVVNALDQAIGMTAKSVDSTDIFLLGLVLDDSTSIAWIDPRNESEPRPEDYLDSAGAKAMIEGRAMLLATLKESKRKSGIMVATWTLNRGLIHGFMTLKQLEASEFWTMRPPTADEIDSIKNPGRKMAEKVIAELPKNVFVPWGGTPFFDRLMEATGAIGAKRQEFMNSMSVEPQASLFAVADGRDRGSQTTPSIVSEEWIRMGVEVFFPMFMGVHNRWEDTDFNVTADRLHVPKHLVFECDGQNRRGIMAAFQTATDTALAGSQTAGQFSQVATGTVSGNAMSGFMNN